VSLNKARAEIKKTTFKDNTSLARSKNLFVAFAEVNVTDCVFSSPTFKDPEVELAEEETMGAFIFIILDVQIIIQGSTFLNGLAKYGGAIYISGQSEITIMNSLLSNNMAKVYGGAIFANGFKSISVLKNSKLTDNIA
jgi:predicted outer membrane repeat protein